MATMISKVEDQHLLKPAYIYIRQSTMGQVRHHQESTERQYALQTKALGMGWAPQKTRVLDRDLGVSGAQIAGREDFKILLADVSMGQVGAIFALEASRLARSNLDWARLIHICALTNTLVIDEDGCYDPADFNDGLLLGMKATIAQAELHFIRARLQGGKLNKAQKGELRFTLPVGLSYGDDGRIELDPDQEVQGAVRLVFKIFREAGSAYAVVQHFASNGLRFPKRAYGGAWDGKLLFGPLYHNRVLGLLRNPSYAGVYAFGRYRTRSDISSDGEVVKRTERVSMDNWKVNIEQHHEGYISFEEFTKNQELLAANRTNGEDVVSSGPAREGHALLQGLLLCAHCGHRLSVRYKGNGGIYPMYNCSALKSGLIGSSCLGVRCDLLDESVSARVLEVICTSQIELAINAVGELEKRDEALSRQWQMRLEKAEYETRLAERRYEEVDPSNRLVAGTLEKRWNDALARQDELKAQFAQFQNSELHVVTSEQKASALALAKDFPRLWQSPSTKHKDKKRLLRHLIKDIAVEKIIDRKQVLLHVRWQGGACEDIYVDLPLKIMDRLRYPEQTISRVRELSLTLYDAQIAQTLNQEGFTPSKSAVFTAASVSWIRFKHQIPCPNLKRADDLTVNELADKLGVSAGVVYYWINSNFVEARRRNGGTQYWITVTPHKEEELRERVRRSTKIQNQRRSSNELTARGAV
jgi:DNA invertase Pin-like site-specific DNA recombinase